LENRIPTSEDDVGIAHRLFKKAVQRGRSEVRDAKKMSVTFVNAREVVSGPCPVSAQRLRGEP